MAAARLLLRYKIQKSNMQEIISFRFSHQQTIDQLKPIEIALQTQGICNSNTTNLRRVASCLLERGVKPDHLIPYFVKRPELIRSQSLHWIKTINFFKGYGYNTNDTLSIVGNNPAILVLSNEYLLKIFSCLQNQGIDSSKLIQFIQENPQILTMKPVMISEKYNMLREVFNNKDSRKVFKSASNILTDSNHVFMNKVKYLTVICGIDKSQIVKSNALRYSLQHIYLRHQFLCLTGHYVKPKSGMKIELCKNPPLKMIWSSEDDVFVNKVAKVTLKEYETFVGLPEHQRVIDSLNKGLMDMEIHGDASDDASDDESDDESD